MKNNFNSFIIEALGMIIGCILASIGLNMFFSPHTIAPGGLSGLSVVLSKISGLSVSMIMLMLGIPLVFFSIKILGKKDAIKRYGIAVARNSGDKQKRGDNRTPTSWGTDVAIPKKYEGAKPNVQSSVVPFEVEEVCEASSWTHDFNDGKGVIQGAYGPWFISLDTGWDGIGIHGTHDPKSIGTKASEGCIRLVNSDVDELKRIICSVNNGVGTKVIITED